MNTYIVRVGNRDYEVDAPDERTAYRWAAAYAKKEAEQRAAAIESEQKAMRERFLQQESNRPWGQRFITNLGAGAYGAWLGARQLAGKVGIGSGVSDEEILEHRRLAEDLAGTMTGGSVTQFAAEALPTLLVPAGGFVKATGLGRVLKKALPRASADAAMAGAAAGALQATTEDESRLVNMGFGAVSGAAVPALVGGIGYGYKRLTKAGARQRAREALVREMGGEQAARQAIADVQTYYPRGAEDIPLSTAAVTQSPALAALERASRARDPAGWMELDAATNRAAWGKVEGATAIADELAARRAARADAWERGTEAAFTKIKPRVFAREIQQFRQEIAQALTSPPGMNQMRPVLMEIQRQLDALGDNITPQHLAALRARMAEGIRGGADDPIAKAPSTDPYFISLRDRIDEILNKATGKKWERVLAEYRAGSRAVEEAKAAKGVREAFLSEQGVPVTGVLGDVPKVTEARLRQALRRYGENRFGDRLGEQQRQALEAVAEALRRQGITQAVKTAGTGGGGSNTLMDLLAQQPARGGDLWARLYDVVLKRGDREMQRELDIMLRSPDEFVNRIRQALEKGKPLSRAQREILAIAYRAPGLVLVGAASAQ